MLQWLTEVDGSNRQLFSFFIKNYEKFHLSPLTPHVDILLLLNETLGGGAGSSAKKNVLSRIYRKRKGARLERTA